MKSRLFKTCSWVLVLVMLINLLPIQAIALETQSAQETVTEDATIQTAGSIDVVLDEEQSLEDATILLEVVENRTEFTKEYKLSNGMHMAIVYPEAVHFQEDGQWKDIDNTLKTKGSGESATYATTAGAWSAEFPQNLRDGAQVSITKDGYTVSFGMAGELRLGDVSASATATYNMRDSQGAAHTMTVSNARESHGQVHDFDYSKEKEQAQHPETIRDKLKSRMSYSNVFNNTDIVYDVNSYQVKESIVINEYDASVYGYLYTLNTGTLVPVLNEDGSIDLLAPNSTEVVMTMPAPFMIDDAGAVSNDVTVALEQKGNVWLLAYQMPIHWLASAERAWPVVLDPVVLANAKSSNIYDRAVCSTASTTRNDGAVMCGYTTHASYGKMRTYIQYVSLPVLTSADVIVNATLSLYACSGTSGITTIEAHAVNEQWDPGDISWNDQPAFDTMIEDYANVDADTGRFCWDITDIARNWYTDANNGVMLKTPDATETGTTHNWKQFYSIDYDKYSPELFPQLAIVFRNTNGLESYWDYTAVSAGRAGTGYVNNFTGNLTWVHSDIGFGGNRMPVSISHIYNTNDSGTNDFGMGYGWKTNYHQIVEEVEAIDDNNNELTTNARYVWIDGDGTKHYFIYDETDKLYKDEDGLELTLSVGSSTYTITDKYGNTSNFDTKGRLTSLKNNQSTKSSITITYTDSTNMRILRITDGAGRKYDFSYSNNLLNRIGYTGTGTSELAYVTFGYSGTNLTTITDQDGKISRFGYSGNLLTNAIDIDGYRIQYTYCAATPKRVVGIGEYDNDVAGSSLTIEYAHNQTTFTDHNGHVQITQFNDWGNVVSIQDDQGRAQFAQYAANSYNDNTGKGNQLTLSSKMQNTVGNRFKYNDFESGSDFTVVSGSGSQARTTQASYFGNKSLTIINDLLLQKTALNVAAGRSETFSAYVKTSGTTAQLEFYDGTNTYVSETLATGSDWTRLQVTYTNTGESTVSVTARIRTEGTGTTYVDSVQWEYAASASRYNLVMNGDFRSSSGGWSSYTGRTTYTPTAAPELSYNVYKMVGNPTAEQRISQTVQVSGGEGDTFVLAGWAKGDSAPLYDNRQFAIIGKFNYADGSSSEEFVAQFNPDTDSNVNWQYSAQVMVAEKAYSSITIEIAYDYNVNTVYFDGIQLFKEEFGSSYTYNDDGDVVSVVDLQKQETTYEYDTSGNLTQIIQDNKAKMTYEYDEYHNVTKATTATGIVYEFTYDAFGNNTSVSIVNGDSRITSSATYSADGNILISTKDALEKETKYGYNVDTNVLEWVQYPEDTEATRTEYSYDTMYRLASATADVDTGYSLDAAYTYAFDLLTSIETNSTTYNFTYGDFDQISSISAGTRTLARYTYNDYLTDKNNYLDKLTYGNNDYIQYTYDDYGRVTQETFEDGDTVTYVYDNSGALATVTDSATGIKTTYYYDFTDRLMKYVESGTGYSHSVGYEFDSLNNLTKLVETINGVDHTVSYSYDEDNRVSSVTQNGLTETYTYDAFGRLSTSILKLGDTVIQEKAYTYNGNSAQLSDITTTVGDYDDTYSYEYDDNGNIISVSSGQYQTTYVYDSANQLIRENNQKREKTWAWTYDDAGNILSKTEYAYTTGELGEPTDTILYGYTDGSWGDLLTSYDGVTLSYDGIGNLLSDGTWTYTWEHGRELVSIAKDDKTWTYTYDANGMRTSRSDGTYTYYYVYNGSQLTEETVLYNGSTYVLHFYYDANGTPKTLSFNGTLYYYVTNVQGDVVAIVDESGEELCTISYDAWGGQYGNIYVVNNDAILVALFNPLTYRGYVFDWETGLYYLQSRYYNPTWGRFLNADAYTSTGQGLLGNNMFAYCRNNPVRRVDITGLYDVDCDSVDSSDDEIVHEEGYLGGGNKTNNSGSQNTPSASSDNALSGAGNNWGNSSGYGKAPTQGTPGTTYTQLSSDGKNEIVSVTTYGEYGAPSQRIDYRGRDHGKGLPHIHVYSWTMRNDRVCPAAKERIYSLKQE